MPNVPSDVVNIEPSHTPDVNGYVTNSLPTHTSLVVGIVNTNPSQCNTNLGTDVDVTGDVVYDQPSHTSLTGGVINTNTTQCYIFLVRTLETTGDVVNAQPSHTVLWKTISKIVLGILKIGAKVGNTIRKNIKKTIYRHTSLVLDPCNCNDTYTKTRSED